MKPSVVWVGVVLPVFTLTAIFQNFRLQNALPTVLQDEYIYSVGAKYGGVEEAARFGNFLYYELYALTLNCGPEFYQCARAINSFWFVALLFVLFVFAKHYLSTPLAFVVTGLFGMGPFGLYTSLFMPEVMFYFFASAGLLLFVQYWEGDGGRLGFVFLLGAFLLLALSALVKPHGTFLAFGLASLVALRGIASGEFRTTRTLFEFLSSLGTFLTGKLALGFVIAGNQGLTVFGNSYTNALLNFFSDFDDLPVEEGPVSDSSENLLGATSESILSNFDAVLIHFGVLLLAACVILGPLLGLLVLTGKTLWKDPATVILSQFLIIGVIVSIFSGHLTAQGDDHSDRLLFRYFEYLIPFLIILGIYKAREYRLTGSKLYIGLGLASVSILTVFTNFQDRQWGIVDSVFLYSIFSTSDSKWLWAATLTIVSYLLFVPTSLSRLGLPLTLAFGIALLGQVGINNQVKINGTKVSSDFAGEYVYENFPNVSGDEILVLGSNRKLVEAAMFAMDKPGIDFRLFTEGSILEADTVPDRYRLVVQTTAVYLDGNGGVTLEGDGFAVTVFDK